MAEIDVRSDQRMQALLEAFDRELVALTASLKGRLTSSEEEMLAHLIQTQVELRTLLQDRVSTSPAVVDFASLEIPAESTKVVNKEVDSIVYAQAMQYARDLVKAIRQKKEQQRRLELTSQQLIRAEKLATIGQVAATVAHELGNILAPLLMYAKLIHEEASGQPELVEIAEFAEQITKIAGRASDMLRQLVDAARSEPAMMIPVDVRSVINNMLNLLTPRIKQQGINIHLHHGQDLPPVMGRPDQLEQLLINITLNAFDAMPTGGSFTISTACGNGFEQQPNQIGHITIRLTDTGVGIPPDDIALLFEPFYTTKGRGVGSGLGLFVSYLIVDQHGGTIEVESELEKGTTFIIKLPAAG
jgi:signal transduction histidine kinase